MIAKGVTSMCKQFGIRKIQTGGYNAKANGCVERFHRWLEAALAILRNRTNGDWESFVPPIVFAYRSSTNDATGFMPFELNHGRLPHLPYNAIFSHDLIHMEPEVYYSKLVEELKRTFALAREAQLKTAMRNEARVKDSKFRPDLNPGDEVYIWKKSSRSIYIIKRISPTGRRPGGRTRQTKRQTKGQRNPPARYTHQAPI